MVNIPTFNPYSLMSFSIEAATPTSLAKSMITTCAQTILSLTIAKSINTKTTDNKDIILTSIQKTHAKEGALNLFKMTTLFMSCVAYRYSLLAEEKTIASIARTLSILSTVILAPTISVLETENHHFSGLSLKTITRIAVMALAIGTTCAYLIPDEFKCVIVTLPKIIQIINSAHALHTGLVQAYDLWINNKTTSSLCCIAYAALELYGLRFVDPFYLAIKMNSSS